ncbi:MAG: hypothetical protein E6G56_06205 [Actinobacteria bacterium]|nr:MAG: hypothetical protein E6G56_06205 [Actinomycetota bacterium]
MAWLETESPSFTARHDAVDAQDAVEVLELLEGTRERLGSVFPALPEQVAVVLHGSPLALALAQPYLPVLRALTAPAGRRYLAGWFSVSELHVLCPRLLEERASQVPGSREMLMLAPAALYAHLTVAHNNPLLPPPFRPGSLLRHLQWGWLTAGAAQYFSGQTGYARPAIARRLREGSAPAFPPGLRDAALLGGSVLDLLVRRRGVRAAVELAVALHPAGPRRALVQAFDGAPLMEIEGGWRAHLGHMAEP